MLRYIINKIFHINKKSLYEEAIQAGVKMGIGNLIVSRFWLPSEPYLISIGNNCQITHGVMMFTHGGANIARHQIPDFDCFGKIVIGNDVYIGSNALIMPGVVIEDHVLVAAGSVVCNSISSGLVVGGNPARIICTVDDYINRNKKYNLNTKRMSNSQKKFILEKTSDEQFISKKYL